LIHFVEVNKDNWEECIDLPISEDHKHNVAPNVYSIAEASFYPELKACCIYAEEKMVGFTMHGLDDEDNRYWIVRLMIAENQRRKGYGREALKLIIEEARQKGIPEIVLSTHPDNFKAIKLYESMGFIDTGEMDGNEEIFICRIERK
jgi:diamine N-acetyltransferase